MARSVTPPPLSDRKRLLASSARRRSGVAPPPRARARSLEAQSASVSTKGREPAREMLDVSRSLDREVKMEVQSDVGDAEVTTPRKWDRMSVKKEPKPSPTSPPLPRFQTKPSSSSTQHPTMAEHQPMLQDSVSSPTRALRFRTPIVAHTEDANTSQGSRQLLFHTTLVAEPPRKKRRYSVGSGQASTSRRRGRVCDSDVRRDDDGNVLMPGKSYFVGVSMPRTADESESTMRRSPRKTKQVEIFSSLHMMGPTRRRRKAPKIISDLTASQTSHEYNDRMKEQVNTLNNAWATRFVDPDVDMHGTSISAANGKGKERAGPPSPMVGPVGLKHVLNKAYQADNAMQGLQPPGSLWDLDMDTLKWVRREPVPPGATLLATDPVAATSSSARALPSPATTPVPQPPPPKRGPGRPRKSSLTSPPQPSPSKPRSHRMSTGRPRGRPRKNPELPASTRKSTGRPRGRPKKLSVSTAPHASGLGRMPDYRLHQSGPDMPPFLVLHEPSVYSASASQYSLPSASDSHTSFFSSSSTAFHPSSLPSASQSVFPAQMQQVYASLAPEAHGEDATPPAPSGASAGGRDDESDVLSYVDPNAPPSPEIGYMIDTEEELDQQATLDYLLNLE